MGNEGIGKSVKRREDYRFLTGQGKYVDDINLMHQTHAWIVRSPYAHATINSIDSDDAAGMPGVVAIYTSADFSEATGCCGWQEIHSDCNNSSMWGFSSPSARST